MLKDVNTKEAWHKFRTRKKHEGKKKRERITSVINVRSTLGQ